MRRAAKEVLIHEFFEQSLACARVEAEQTAFLGHGQREAGHFEIFTDDTLAHVIGWSNERGTVRHAISWSKPGATSARIYSVIRLMICAC